MTHKLLKCSRCQNAFLNGLKIDDNYVWVECPTCKKTGVKINYHNEHSKLIAGEIALTRWH